MIESHSQNSSSSGPDGMAGERRSSPRIPLARPIRIGSPGGLPYATVSARDLSVGGLFVDAERSVKVGSRFSIEVNLDGGDRVYVTEAEVTDNRRLGRASGFGARFVKISDDARRLIEAQVASHANATLRDTEGFGAFDHLEVPTLEEPFLGADLRDMSDVARVNDAMASVIPSEEPGAPTLQVRVRTRWSKMKAWLRSLPALSALLYGAAAAALIAVAVGLLLGEGPEPSETIAQVEPGMLPEEVHDQAAGSGRPVGFAEPAVLTDEDLNVVNSLPDAPAPRRAAAPAEPSREVGFVEPSRSDRPATEKRARTEPKKATRPEPKKATRPAPEPSRAEPSRPARAAAGRFELNLGSGASVKRSFSMKGKFVVDVSGYAGDPRLPAGSGAVQQIRYGRHDGFSRFVFDLKRPAEGRAQVQGGRLVVSITPR